MTTITIDELETRVREVIDELARGGEPVAITRDGTVVAEINSTAAPTTRVLNATPSRTEEERAAYWQRLNQLAKQIGEVWPAGVSAVEAVREQRRDL